MLVQFPIGDWSDDGHGKCDWFDVETNKTDKEIISAHYRFEKETGIQIGKLCGEYEQGSLTEEQYEDLFELFEGRQLNHFGTTHDDIEISWFSPEEGNITTQTILILWLNCLQYADPELQFTVIQDDAPKIYNWNKNTREVAKENGDNHWYLRGPGYGLFW